MSSLNDFIVSRTFNTEAMTLNGGAVDTSPRELAYTIPSGYKVLTYGTNCTWSASTQNGNFTVTQCYLDTQNSKIKFRLGNVNNSAASDVVFITILFIRN